MMMMQYQTIYYIFIAIVVLLSYNEVQGITKISHLDDLELEKQLNLLNKPAIKTIKTKFGDIYDCVDFYKQPAFDHPLLRNHTYHPKMKPTLSITKEGHDNSINSWPLKMGFKRGGCPDGSVPIRRITKDDLIRQKFMTPTEDVSFNNSLSSEKDFGDKVSFPSKWYKLAIVQTEYNPSNKFGGAGMLTNVYNPKVQGQQHSACRMKIQKGSENIQVGWRVDPTLYGDTRTRLYTHFQAGQTQCFNTQCPGFVVVNSEIPLDYVFSGVSQNGILISWEESMYIVRDVVDGNWWLMLTLNKTQIGFWPSKIFTELNDFADTISWGGVAYSAANVLEPPMGAGIFPLGDFNNDSYCRRIKTIDDNGRESDSGDLTVYMTNPDLYKAIYTANNGYQGADYSHVFYGGPGEA